MSETGTNQRMALYRKWRPDNFSKVVGQQHVTKILSGQIASGKQAHAYIFTGTRGTGKTTCARILARALCCEHPVNGEPCNECEACRAILGETTLDVSEIDAASNRSVDYMRSLREEAVFAPSFLKRRIYIIDEVHMLSTDSFNALLKTLEEPPAHVFFILATTEIHKVPATILSRCQRFDFRRIPSDVIASQLSMIASSEGIELQPGAAAILSRLADGSMRDGISLLDRCLAIGSIITADSVVDALGVPSPRSILEIYRAVNDRDATRAIDLFTGCYMEGRDIVSLFDELFRLYRDIYMAIAGGRGASFISSCASEEQTILELASQTDRRDLDHYVAVVSELIGRTTRTAMKRSDAELCLLKMALRGAAAPVPVQSAAPAPVSKPAREPLRSTPPAAPVREAPAPSAKPAPTEEAPPFDPDPPKKQEAPAVSQPRPEPERPAEVQPRPEAEKPSAGGGDLLESFVSRMMGARSCLHIFRQSVYSVTGDNLDIAVPEDLFPDVDQLRIKNLANRAASEMGFAAARIRSASSSEMTPPEAASKRAGSMSSVLERAKQFGIPVKREQ